MGVGGGGGGSGWRSGLEKRRCGRKQIGPRVLDTCKTRTVRESPNLF